MKKVNKKKKNINKNIKKNIPIIASVCVLVILIAITLIFLTPFKFEDNKENNDNNPTDNSNNLLGEKNEIKNLSLKELKEKFNVNTSDFENTNYGCSIENTSINFNGSYEDQVILLACDAFLID